MEQNSVRSGEVEFLLFLNRIEPFIIYNLNLISKNLLKIVLSLSSQRIKKSDRQADLRIKNVH